jgi:hypothetical protein
MSKTRWFIGKETSPDAFIPFMDGETTVWLMTKKIDGVERLIGIHHPDGAEASEKWYNDNKAMLDEKYKDQK